MPGAEPARGSAAEPRQTESPSRPGGIRCAECGAEVDRGSALATYRWRRLETGAPPAREALVVCGPTCLDARTAANDYATFGVGLPSDGDRLLAKEVGRPE